MTILERARHNQDVRTLLAEGLDLNLLDSLEQPDDVNGRLIWSMPAQTFALTGDGSQYLLLPDGSVAFWSTDGNAGRLAENMEEFFTLAVNCGDWQYFTVRPAGADETWFLDSERLNNFANERMQWSRECLQSIHIDLNAMQRNLSCTLGVPLYPKLGTVLSRFYEATLREPRFTAAYREDDGSLTRSPGLLIELYDSANTPPTPLPSLDREPTATELSALAEKYGLIPPAR